ncbi:Ig-like domain-containing protein [Tropicibacter oceani]|uniref:Ig-like domain-containing protein n=1 Tax=Tropicibacter oceani TaxID=3058420 RepID=A0ABY8QKY2_9RHOB|nr:Ig-like domain-containing protein [Tropicibacter oceani]WGW05285.1 Ig-like domain-containing protein [Tropicibacter oceani]
MAGENQGFLIDAGAGNDISLNISQANLRGYDRAADDLLITLADGRVIVLEGYFAGGEENRLFLSAEGTLNQVSFVEADGGALYAQYGPTETFGKWSPSDDLIFLDEPRVVADAGYYEEDEVSMLGAGLLGGAAGLGGLGAATAGLAGLGLLGLTGGDGDGGDGDGGDGGGTGPAVPTVDNPDASIDIGGGDDPKLVITGTGEPGDDVSITIDDDTVTTVIEDDGTWEVIFDGDDFPPDGIYEDVVVVVTHPDGGTTELDGPSFEIDTTPPALEIDSGTVSLGDLFNAEGYEEGGVSVSGTAEVGATVVMVVGDYQQSVVVGESGTWTFSFDEVTFPAGEYTTDITITATDSFGNATVVSDSVQVDTIGLVSLDNAPLTGDDLIGQGEYDAGVTLSGSSQAGSSVVVTIEGVSHSVTAGADGSWSVTFAKGDLPAGTYTTSATIVATDAAGNVASATHSFDVDTEISLSMNTGTVGGDGMVNASERAAGVVLTGSAEAGSSVVVMVSGTELTATVAANGSWSVNIPTGLIPEGETSLAVTATATDAAGNSTSTSGTIAVDTMTAVSVQTAGVEGDGVVNAAEHADGVTLTGNAEAGSTVMVTLGSVTKAATVAANGSWSVNYTASEIPTGERTLPVSAVSTDAAGNTATATGDLQVDTLVRNFTNTSTPGGADGVLNAQEASQGLTLTGTTEPGGTVKVTLDGVVKSATVDANGNWTVTYGSSELPSGERTVSLVAVSTDAAGNTDTLTQSVRVDTEAGILTISPAPVEGDDIVNFAEASDGVVLTGTSNPFEMVTVTMNGVSHTVQTNANGVWTAPFASYEVAPGTYTAEITATITDSAGNTLTRTDSVRVDTEVENFAPSSAPIETDGVINKVEASNGVTLAGTTEVGGSIQVVFEGMSYTGVVDSAGNWTVNLPASAMLSGEKSGNAKVLTTDAAGNTAEASVTLTFDTLVTVLTMSDAPITADNVVNAAEAAEGITLNGQVEAGSSVMITFGGVVHEATVNSAGQWTLDVPSSSIPLGTRNETVLIQATDAAGNTKSITETIAIDTDAPGALDWEGYGRNHKGVDEIRTEITEDTVEIGVVVNPGSNPSVADVPLSSSYDVDPLGVTYHSFTSSVPDGSHLVVTATDAAGNTSGNYLVTDDPATNEVTMTDALANVLSNYQIESIDLTFAEDSHLTITEAQIVALSSNTDTLVVHGGADESVTITGATHTGTTTVGTETFNTYSLGDATLMIDDDITNVNGLV